MGLKKKGKGFLTEFREFIMRGNVIDMAVGVVIATAFGKITTALVNNIIMPLLGFYLLDGIDLSKYDIVLKEAVVDAAGVEVEAAVVVGIGTLLVTIVDFIIIAFAIFLTIKFLAKLKDIAEKRKKKEEEAAAEEAPKGPTTEELLTEILAELKKDKKE